IFDRFSRGQAGRRRSAGAGLGLHIARSVVELHGGRLWVAGNAAGGSSFWCILPLHSGETTITSDAIPIMVDALELPAEDDIEPERIAARAGEFSLETDGMSHEIADRGR
ncbi:MAG TPA: ATP-binding protein, partial [Ktedonobacterales bacterium]|nr:ATP-binding protein [Ktedonobacterales bacterium]